jgi:hypothetical protein
MLAALHPWRGFSAPIENAGSNVFVPKGKKMPEKKS